ncbi:MAG: hypothetical protein ACE368_12135 [Paracoccaceae bacterium]
MIVFLAVLAGALWGAYLARSRKGNALDMAQYAVGFAIFFGVAAFLLTLVLARVLM